MPGAFQMQSQQESEWCWAAVSASVERYFVPTSLQTQCMIARAVLGIAGCCGDPTPCNQPALLQNALKLLRRMTGDPTAGPLSFAEIQSDIDGGRPVCLRIGWDGGGGHFVALAGYRLSRSGVQLVDVEDPLYGPSVVIYDDFVSNYLGRGQWTATYPV
jgi:hypothetical protein